MKRYDKYIRLSINIIIILLVLFNLNQNFCSGINSEIQIKESDEFDKKDSDIENIDIVHQQNNNLSEKQDPQLNKTLHDFNSSQSAISNKSSKNSATSQIISQIKNNKKQTRRIKTNTILHDNLFLTPHIEISIYPSYLPKIHNNSCYSTPFAIFVDMKNFTANTTYGFKAYIVGNTSNIYPSNQIWANGKWQYSYNYFDVFTDENGSCSQWYYLRFNKNYQEYQNNIQHNENAYIMVRIKRDEITTTSKKIHLLDMDESTTNATSGGYAIGIAQKNSTIFNNKTIMIKNTTQHITALYKTQITAFNDGFISEPGYYKLPSPLGDNYTIFILDDNHTTVHSWSNITILQGEFKINTSFETSLYQIKRNTSLTIPFHINNTGDFPDSYHIYIQSENKGWNITLNKHNLSLNPLEKSIINLTVIPCQLHSCRGTDINISIRSDTDYAITESLVFSIGILCPDLTITNATMYSEIGQISNIFGQGEIIKIRANVRNIGTDIAKNVEISYYYNVIDDDHLIGTRYYEDIAQYQKYPSVHWDSLNVACGNHTIIILVDEKNTSEEFNYSNNKFYLPLTIFPTFPPNGNHKIVISEVYYHTYPTLKNEFITLYNPLHRSVDISGWYLTNRQRRKKDDTTKIVFPSNTRISAKSKLIITQNATAFLYQTGYLPDFEYDINSRDDVVQMIKYKNLVLSNNGGSVTLKSSYNHTIDAMCYGDTNSNITGWNGPPVPHSGVGVILKRNSNHFSYVDTNTSIDWQSPRIYGIGQSDFPYQTFNCTGQILTFISPDNSYATVVSEIRNATESIHFNIYEFTNPHLALELINALSRNVSVNIFVEGGPVGGMSDTQKGILNELFLHGGTIRFIVNDVANRVHQRYRFNHAKYLVIDNMTVIVESSNWALTGMPVEPTYGNREWGIVIRNDTIASNFLDVFYADWNPILADSYSFEDMNFEIPYDFTMNLNISMGSYVPNFPSEMYQGNFTVTPVFSPDNSQQAIIDMITSAQESIFIQQLYIYRDWGDEISPFVSHLVEKKVQDNIDIKIILNYNPWYTSTAINLNKTKNYLEEYGVEVRFHYTNWSIFNNVHNKGMIVDNTSVLISSINWNENSVKRNREAGIIITHEDVARYYAEVFFYDWNIKINNDMKTIYNEPEGSEHDESNLIDNIDEYNNNNETFIFSTMQDFLIAYKNHWLILFIYLVTFLLIARDWRKRKWIS